MKKYSAFSLIELSIVILIIGILVAGVTQGSRLVRQFRLSTARQITQSAPVASISGLSLWLETTSANSVATGTSTFTTVDDPDDGTAIGQWNDINPVSLTKNNVTQTTAANQPLYKSSSINSLPSLLFDGSNDCFSISNFSMSNISYNSALSVFIVQKMTGTSSTNSSIISWEPTVLSDRFIIFSPWANTLMIDSGNYVNTRVQYTVPSSFYNNAQLISFRRSSVNADMWLNGISVASISNAGSFMSAATSSFEVSGCVTTFPGSIGEIIIFNRGLKVEERQAVESYLGKKWGIKIN